MTNLLIISESFAPKNAVASIRFTKTAKYLARTGQYRIWVITEEPPLTEARDEILRRDMESVKDAVTVVYIKNQRLGKRAKNAKNAKNAGTLGAKSPGAGTGAAATAAGAAASATAAAKGPEPATFYTPGERISLKKRLMARYLFHYQKTFAAKGCKAARKLMGQVKFDAVITTYGGIGAVMAGLRIKKAAPRIRWILDYRDVINAKTPALIRKQQKIARRADGLCDEITGATIDCVGSGAHTEKFTEITNAADAEDIEALTADPREHSPSPGEHSPSPEVLRLCFSGSFYPGMDNAEPLFEALSEIIDKGQISRDRVRVTLMGKNPAAIVAAAAKQGLSDILDVRGFVPRADSLRAQRDSDILLSFTQNTVETGHFMHAKLMEYLMMDRKLLCMVNGDVPGSFNCRLIRENGLGECYEEANRQEDSIRLKSFLKECYDEKLATGGIAYETPADIKERFSSKAMAMKFDRLIRA